MQKDWRFIPSLKAFVAVLIACAAVALNYQGAFAQEQEQDTNTKTYVLMTGGTWGPAQDTAVLASGGTVLFSHGPSGLATATSSDPVFMRKALKNSAITACSEDMTIQ